MNVRSSVPKNVSTPKASLRFTSQSLRWEVLPGTEPLPGKILDSPGQIVTRSPMRVVTRHSIGEETFYIKTYFHHATAFASLKYFFKVPASRAEWQLAPQLEQLGIPVVPHLAHGERWNWRGLQESILITKGPANFVPLKSITPSATIQAALGKFLRKLHEHSIFHTDLHVSNLLYSPQTNEFCLVDLDNIKILGSLDQQQRMDNLATLNRRWPLSPDFYEAYGSEFLDLAGEIAQRAERKHRAAIPKKLELLFANGSLFTRKKMGELNWHVRLRPWNENLEPILTQPDEFLATRAVLLKNGTRSTVGCTDELVLKRFNFKKISTAIFDCFRASRARQAFRIARHLELLKIAAPRPLACADQRRFGFVLRSYFVMEKIPCAIYLWKCPDQRQQHARNLAQLIAKIHSEGFSHRDLKETNIVSDASGIPCLIDLDALHHVKNISSQRAAVELTRLLEGFSRRTRISTKERIRFLKTYCKCRQIADWRCWWNNIGENLVVGKSK